MSSISIVGTVGMVTAVGIALVKLLLLEKPEGHHRVANTGQDFKVAMVALFDIVSACLSEGAVLTVASAGPQLCMLCAEVAPTPDLRNQRWPSRI